MLVAGRSRVSRGPPLGFLVSIIPTLRKVRMLTGSDDTITMWVNGEKVLAKNVSRGVTKDEDKTDVTLKKGENRVLIKVCQGIGGWGLAFRIVDPETGEQMPF